MILLVVLIVGIAAAANAAGLPWPAAIAVGVLLPVLGSSVYLRASNQNAPEHKLIPNDARTRRFLVMLSERYRSGGYAYGATSLDDVLWSYDSGRLLEANQQFGALSGVVARHPGATTLISVWQRTWRDSREQPASISVSADPMSRTTSDPPPTTPLEPSEQGARPNLAQAVGEPTPTPDRVQPPPAVGGTLHCGGTIVSYDASKPEDLRVIVANGLVWASGAKAQQAAVDALVAGTLPMNDRVPPAIRALIEQVK